MSLPRSILEAVVDSKEFEEFCDKHGFCQTSEDHTLAYDAARFGAEWLFHHLTEMAGKEFDEEATEQLVHDKLFAGSGGQAVTIRKLIIEGMRHQHALDQAALLSLRDSLILAKQQRDGFELELKSARETIAILKKTNSKLLSDLSNYLGDA